MIRYGIKILRKLFTAVTRNPLGAITHVTTEDPVAALTFDDGPHPEFTPRLLEILEKHNAQATFFMLGESAEKYPELVQFVARAGHAIGNHSWNHPAFSLISAHERRKQIQACEKALTPYGQRIFRPPYGEQSLRTLFDAARLHHQVIMWSLDVGDWYDTDAVHLADQLIKSIRPGSVILMHDALIRHPQAEHEPVLARQPYIDRRSAIKAVDLFLKRLSGQWRFVTIPELLRHGRPQRQSWYRTIPAG